MRFVVAGGGGGGQTGVEQRNARDDSAARLVLLREAQTKSQGEGAKKFFARAEAKSDSNTRHEIKRKSARLNVHTV